MPHRISRTSLRVGLSTAEHKQPDPPLLTMRGSWLCLSRLPCSRPMSRSLSSPQLLGVRRNRKRDHQNYGLQFRAQVEKRPTNIVAAHGYFVRPDLPYPLFINNSRSLHFLLATWPLWQSCSPALWRESTMAFNLTFQLNQSILEAKAA